jgi:hypothetical protein
MAALPGGPPQLFPPDFYLQVLSTAWLIVKLIWPFLLPFAILGVLRLLIDRAAQSRPERVVRARAPRAAGREPMSGSVEEPAASLLVLAGLRSSGAITRRELAAAKRMVLEKQARPSTADATAIADLFELHQRGALSEGEYNSKKWEILASRM